MARHRIITFLEGEGGLKAVDEDFRELVRLFYCVPGFATYGVSCSGHFYPDWGKMYNEPAFWPKPWGNLGLIATPECRHVSKLLNLIQDHINKDPDARMYIKEKHKFLPPNEREVYAPDVDLKKFSYGKTKDGFDINLLEIMLGDNGSLDSVPDHLCAPIIIKGNSEAFKKTEERYLQIKSFWKMLEDRTREYNQENGFINPDFDKREFERLIK